MARLVSSLTNHQILLGRLPSGPVDGSEFNVREVAVAQPRTGEVLVRNIYLSIDPANRAWMQARTYRTQLAAGDVMAGNTIAEVVAGDLPVGTIVRCPGGWQEYATVPVAEATVIEVRGKLSHYLGVFGINGLTAYLGLFDIGRPEPRETVVVSAAAGATGAIVGQLARAAGARVVGITGSDSKNDLLRERLGFTATVNHRDAAFGAGLRSACPDGIDVYFDNVGGPILEHVLIGMNVHGRIVCCGAVSQYDTAHPAAGPRGIPGHLITKRIRMEGFIVYDLRQRWPAALDDLHRRVGDGGVTVLEEIVPGLRAAPNALIGQLAGDNVGKRIVQIGDEPAHQHGRTT